MIGDGERLNFGSPNISDAGVLAEVIKQTRGPKINIIYKRRRKNSRRKQGHKQDLTLVKIKEITSTGISKIKLKKGSLKKDENKPLKAEAKPSTKLNQHQKDVLAKKKTITKKNKD